MIRPSAARIDRVLSGMAERARKPSMLGSFSGRRSAFQILIATILSARSRDERTDEVAAALFRKYPKAKDLAVLSPSRLHGLLKPIGFYRAKAGYLVETARRIIDRHNGRVPRTLEELIALPGVGRKVANCVLVYAFGIPAIAVDTHVHRISNRLGWVETRTPEETEKALIDFLPRAHWLEVNDVMVRFGKSICRPISPRCGECPVRKDCREGQKLKAKETKA